MIHHANTLCQATVAGQLWLKSSFGECYSVTVLVFPKKLCIPAYISSVVT